jgi:CheY-like chemotaxis protein
MPQILAGIRILVVDDHADSREVLAQTLSFEGATVTAVSTARGPSVLGQDVTSF